MKVLPQEDKERIRSARDEARRLRVADDIARTDRKFRRLERGIFCFIVLLLVVLSACLLWNMSTKGERTRRRYRPETYAAFTNLVSMASAIETEHADAMGRLDFDLLKNYALLERSNDFSPFLEEIARARAVVLYSREETKMLFKELYALFPPDSVNERHDAQKIYGELMTVIDVSEERVDAAEKALQLLVAHRGKWHARKGTVEFADSALKAEFDSLGQDPDEETARWRRDFGVIESNIVEVPKEGDQGTNHVQR